MKYAIALLMSALWLPCQAQMKTFDILNLEQKVGHSKKLKDKHDEMRDNQLVSTATQTVAQKEGEKFKDKVTEIHDRMIKVQGLLRDGQKLAQATKIVSDIVSYQRDIVKIVSNDPKLLVFAVNSQTLIVKRCQSLATFIAIIPVSFNKWNVISDSDRKEILQHITTELRVIRGDAFGLKRQLEWAKNYNYWQKLNPWQGYVNKDKRLVKDILEKTKF